jgi:hypothetical protein
MRNSREKDFSYWLFLAINFSVKKVELMLRFFSSFDQNSVQNSSFLTKSKLTGLKHTLFIASSEETVSSSIKRKIHPN